MAAIALRGLGGDAARSFRDRPAAGHRDRLPQLLDRHVVEQHGIHADRQRLFELRQRIDLDLDLDQVAGMRLCARDRGPDIAGQRDVVVLDQDGVIEAKAVIAAAPGAHRVFFQRAQSGRGFAGADDARLGALCGRHQRGRRGGDAAEVAEKVQRGPLAGQQSARRPLDGGDHVARCHHAAVRSLHGEPDGRIRRAERHSARCRARPRRRLARAQHQ